MADSRKAKPVVTFLFDMTARTCQLWQSWITEGSCSQEAFLDMVLPRNMGGCKLLGLAYLEMILIPPCMHIRELVLGIYSVHSSLAFNLYSLKRTSLSTDKILKLLLAGVHKI